MQSLNTENTQIKAFVQLCESGRKPSRFMKTSLYLGVIRRAKDSFGDWQECFSVTAFWGRPYSVAEYDAIIECPDMNGKAAVTLIGAVHAQSLLLGRRAYSQGSWQNNGRTVWAHAPIWGHKEVKP